LPVVVIVVIVVISIVRIVRFSVPLVVFIFATVTRGFGTRVAADHNLRYIHDFGLIELRFSTRNIA
jgi:hypothetical protein